MIFLPGSPDTFALVTGMWLERYIPRMQLKLEQPKRGGEGSFLPVSEVHLHLPVVIGEVTGWVTGSLIQGG